MSIPSSVDRTNLLKNLALEKDAPEMMSVPVRPLPSSVFCLAVALEVFNNLKSRGSLRPEVVKDQMVDSYKRLLAI